MKITGVPVRDPNFLHEKFLVLSSGIEPESNP